MDQNAPTLFEVKQAPAPKGALRLAAEATIEAKRRANLLTAEHDLTIALVLELATAVDAGFRAAKVSTVTGHLAKELREAMASLPEPTTAGAGEAWDAIVRDLSQ